MFGGLIMGNDVSDNEIFFRMNFFILEALYIKLIEHINNIYPAAHLDKKNRELFYREIMRSNRTDYSKYKNGSCDKTKITSTMEKELLEECTELRKHLIGRELIQIGGINPKWALEIIEKNPAEIMKECLDKVDLLTKNIVISCKESLKPDIKTGTADRICLWMCRYIIENWVETRGAEAKIEAKLRALEEISISDIDRCSPEKLDDYYKRISKVYEYFKKIRDYKALVKK